MQLVYYVPYSGEFAQGIWLGVALATLAPRGATSRAGQSQRGVARSALNGAGEHVGRHVDAVIDA
jgi:hypothetical protein